MSKKYTSAELQQHNKYAIEYFNRILQDLSGNTSDIGWGKLEEKTASDDAAQNDFNSSLDELTLENSDDLILQNNGVPDIYTDDEEISYEELMRKKARKEQEEILENDKREINSLGDSSSLDNNETKITTEKLLQQWQEMNKKRQQELLKNDLNIEDESSIDTSSKNEDGWQNKVDYDDEDDIDLTRENDNDGLDLKRENDDDEDAIDLKRENGDDEDDIDLKRKNDDEDSDGDWEIIIDED